MYADDQLKGWSEWDQENEEEWHALGLEELDSFYDASVHASPQLLSRLFVPTKLDLASQLPELPDTDAKTTDDDRSSPSPKAQATTTAVPPTLARSEIDGAGQRSTSPGPLPTDAALVTDSKSSTAVAPSPPSSCSSTQVPESCRDSRQSTPVCDSSPSPGSPTRVQAPLMYGAMPSRSPSTGRHRLSTEMRREEKHSNPFAQINKTPVRPFKLATPLRLLGTVVKKERDLSPPLSNERNPDIARSKSPRGRYESRWTPPRHRSSSKSHQVSRVHRSLTTSMTVTASSKTSRPSSPDPLTASNHHITIKSSPDNATEAQGGTSRSASSSPDPLTTSSPQLKKQKTKHRKMYTWYERRTTRSVAQAPEPEVRPPSTSLVLKISKRLKDLQSQRAIAIKGEATADGTPSSSIPSPTEFAGLKPARLNQESPKPIAVASADGSDSTLTDLSCNEAEVNSVQAVVAQASAMSHPETLQTRPTKRPARKRVGVHELANVLGGRHDEGLGNLGLVSLGGSPRATRKTRQDATQDARQKRDREPNAAATAKRRHSAVNSVPSKKKKKK